MSITTAVSSRRQLNTFGPVASASHAATDTGSQHLGGSLEQFRGNPWEVNAFLDGAQSET